ncbi:MAG TPA: shikimate dehydrogenase, partial [bacterium]|nr:shikimate dehydrogenase [bacterium]
AGVRGFNLTVPHKVAILPLLHEQDAAARAVGAVNTVRCSDGRLMGTNTDGAGFHLSLRQDLNWSPAGKAVLLLGAGGAARSVAQALLQDGAALLTIANRTLAHAQELAELLATRFPRQRVRAVALDALGAERPHLLVNATTVGMGDGLCPVNLPRLGVQEAVLDIVYHPAETPLLAQARALRLPCANGVGMLLYQGTAAFEFWTGRAAPEEAMRQALLRGMAIQEQETAPAHDTRA